MAAKPVNGDFLRRCKSLRPKINILFQVLPSAYKNCLYYSKDDYGDDRTGPLGKSCELPTRDDNLQPDCRVLSS